MNWLIPAITTSLIGTLILFLIYAYFYKEEKKKYIGVLTLGWLMYCARLSTSLLSETSTYPQYFILLSHIFMTASSLLISYGTYLFIEKKFPRIFFYIAAIAVFWSISAAALKLPFYFLSMLPILFTAFVFMFAGISFLKSSESKLIAAKITGWALFLWGLHKLDYPLLRENFTLAPWGFLLSSVLALITAIGLILLFNERTKRELVLSIEKLKELDEIINRSPAVAFLWKAEENWPVDFVSENVRQWGYEPDEFLTGKILYADIVYKEDLDRVAQEVMHYSNAGYKEFKQEYRILTKSGEVRWIEDWTWVRRDKGRITHYEGIIIDSTQKKEFEISFKKSEEQLIDANVKLSAIFNASPVAIIKLNKEKKIELWNSAAEKLFGFKAEEVLGKPYSFFSPDKEKDFERNFERVIKGESLKEKEIVRRRKDGLEFYARLSTAPIRDEHGNVAAVMAMISDITEQKKAEEEINFNSERLKLIASVTCEIVASNQLRKQLDKFTELVCDTFRVDACVIRKLEDDSLTLLAARGVPPEILRNTFPANVGIAKEILSSRRPLAIEDTGVHPLTKDGDQFNKTPNNFISYAGAPMLIDNRVTGIIGIYTSERMIHFTERDLEHLQIVANHIAVALENENLINQLEKQAEIFIEEITERKNAEETLRKREAEFRALVENTPDIIARVDENLKCLYVNPAIKRLTGLDPSFIIGKKIDKIELTKSSTLNLNAISEVFKTGKENLTKFDLELPEGKKFIESRIIPEFNDRGEVETVLVLATDVTERKLYEEERFQLLTVLEASVNEIYIFDAKTLQFTFVNEGAVKNLGYSSNEIMNMTPVNIKPEFNEESFRKLIEPLLKHEKEKLVFITEHLRANGTRYPVEVNLQLIELPFKRIFLAIVLDLTGRLEAEEALRKSEERYRLLFLNNPLPMWVYDSDTFEFLTVNEAAVNNYGYSREDFLTMTIEDIRPPDEVESLEKFVKEHEAGYRKAGVWKHKKKSGEIIDVEIVSHDVVFADRKARLVLANDVTERKKAEDNLRESREQLRALAANLQSVREEERASIAREIHDELGQVLTSLKMNLTLLGRSISAGISSIDIDSIQSEIEGMKEIIDSSVKSVRKLITELRPEVLDNLGLISALEWQAQEFETNTGIKCSLEGLDIELEIGRDESIAIFRIFQEALTNIARHSGATHVQIEINRDEKNFFMRIIDNGKGFSSDEKKGEKTFGLIGMRERAAILGGNLEIESYPNLGTSISVVIPISKKS
jgi:two-component system sensor histidine kinase UhpB